MKITKKELLAFIKEKLSKDKQWIKKALIKIYNQQTGLEKTLKENFDSNGVGFDSYDCSILSSFAEQYKTNKELSYKQIKILKYKMPKYAKQIFNLSDQNKLKKLYLEENSQTELIFN
jgi:hypothetical protein